MSDSFDLGEPPQPKRQEAYRVLARKYRPQRFSELIGQDAMVQTLANAIKRDRLAHAFLMTGVRGVGKTSTARLIAKALNCIGPDGKGGPTIDPCGVCEPCVAIAEGRHIDVVEMDAASHTGIDDIREIIEAVRYAAVSARYKVYIIDEVHMLSKAAFNGLLKTLEEPPAHVKFLFATTEVNKVPVTVLSRCQRFDLKRIPAEKLVENFAYICRNEGVEAEPEALALIARAAEGSARDGQSILDQAIAHADMDSGGVTAGQVRDMLGLSDRGAVRRMFAALLAADVPEVLAQAEQQDALGVEPVALLRGLLEVVHGVTRAKAGGAEDLALSVEEREAYADWASRMGFATLHRLWQLLLKGHAEILSAPNPREAAEMALLRVVHASQLPDPGELAKRLQAGQVAIAPATAAPAGTTAAPTALAPEIKPAPSPSKIPADFETLVGLIEGKRASLGLQLRDDASLVRYAPPVLEIWPRRPLDVGTLRKLLRDLTDEEWDVVLAEQKGDLTLHEQERAAAAAARDAILNAPMVAAVRAAFPDAELIDDLRSATS
ncbi:DNA polymerase III subunit gamma/tau [Sphingomonas sp. MMS24-J13]|uniref:DNA polymerase III subunit gamma/tau n=1 Tax=Sphingomonas sp. MMS24-J13 TaxID=3238686 RepID=UPI003850278D